MNRQRRFQDNFASSSCRIPDRTDEYEYNNSRTGNYSRSTTHNNDFAQSNDYQQNDYNYSQGPSGHGPRYSSDSSKVYSDRMNCDASYDYGSNYTNRSNNRSGNFQDNSFQSSAFGGPSDSPSIDYQGAGRSSGFDCSRPLNRSSWGSMGESSDETRKRHYPDEDNGWGRDATKQKRIDSEAVPLDLTRPQRHDTTTRKLLTCEVCDMTFGDVEMFQVHANTVVHINNAAFAVERTLAKAMPASLATNSMPFQKSLLGPVPNAPSTDRNSYGNLVNKQKNVLNQFVKRSPQTLTQNNATNYDNQTELAKLFKEPLRTYPNNNNWQRNNKQMIGTNQNNRFKSEQSPQQDHAKFKPRNSFGNNNAFRQQSFPQKTFQREQYAQSKWKKSVQNTPNHGDTKKQSQVLPKSATKSSVHQADGTKVESEATSSKPDSSSLLCAAEEVKSESESVALEYEDNVYIELNFKPSLSTSKVCDDLETPETAKEAEATSRNLVDPEGEDAKTGEDGDEDVPPGQEYVVSVTGFFCKLCSKFYNKESMAKFDHCRSDQHVRNYRKVHPESKDGNSSQDALP